MFIFHSLKSRIVLGLIWLGGWLQFTNPPSFAEELDSHSANTAATEYNALRREMSQQQQEIDSLRSIISSILEEPQRIHQIPPAPVLQEQPGIVYFSGALDEEQPLPGSSVVQPNNNGLEQIGSTQFEGERKTNGVGIDFNTTKSVFSEGIVVEGSGVVAKIGGYVKADFIQDFDPISDEYTFNTTTIEIGAPPRENSTIHARQSRLNLDTRWDSDFGPVRSFVEADLFGNGNSAGTSFSFRLRHAYGEVRNLIVGQTWSTFANVRTLPNTLDNEGSASVVNRRQGLIRWTQPVLTEDLTIGLALEDPRSIIVQPSMTPQLSPLNESPDFHLRLRLEDETKSFQVSSVFRKLAVQAPMGTLTDEAWGMNISAALHLSDRDEIYSQLMFGDGIGSYRNLPDITTDGVANAALLSSFSWMVGFTHEWNDVLQSNVVYSESRLSNPFFAQATDLESNTYFAVNLICRPIERYFMGVEYLYGTRTDFDGQDAEAHRIQSSFGFYLP